MQKERRNRKRIKADMMRSYYIMESKVDAKARERFSRESLMLWRSKVLNGGTGDFLKIPRPHLTVFLSLAFGQPSCYDDFTSNSRIFVLLNFLTSGQSFQAFQPEIPKSLMKKIGIKEALPMGKANTSVNQWLRDNHRFASLYNGYVFGGRQIIRPEELEDLDRETDILVTDKEGKTKAGGKAQGYC